MQPLTQKLLSDIYDAATFIRDRTRGMSEAQYVADRLIRQAAERNFEIIGEATSRLRKSDPAVATQISDADRIVAFRNVLIHGYHAIDDAEVWRVIVDSLPILIREVEALIGPPPAPSNAP